MRASNDRSGFQSRIERREAPFKPTNRVKTMTVSTLVFDAYGTLYDVQSVRVLTELLCPGKGDAITQVWRLKQLEYTWLRSLLEDYEDFWSVTRSSLEFALRSVGIEPTTALVEPLMAKYLDLDLYPEARRALEGLIGRKLGILSNGSPSMLRALTKASGIADLLDAVISIDRAKIYKPNPRCYGLVEEALGVVRGDVLFVSSNSFDVVGAKRFGFKVAWIQRAGGLAPDSDGPGGPGQMYRMLRGRAEELGREPDFCVSTLTELLSLL